jgi:RimJ/RimL family protein N-acetyltransferase
VVRALSDTNGHLTTERLALRRFTRDDLEWLVTLYADDEVTRYLGGSRDRAAVTELLETRILRYYDEHPGLGIWQTIERATGQPVGFHLLNHIQGEQIIQVGYSLVRSAWRKGYATEMAREIMRYGFVDRGLPRIAAIANLPNVASHNVLLKIGLERRGSRVFPHPAYASQGPMAFFEIEARRWPRLASISQAR